MMQLYRNSSFFRRSVKILVFILLIMAIRAYVLRNTVSGEAPEFSGTTLKQQQVSLKQYRGKPVLIHFWSSWCGICQYEQDNIQAIAGDYMVLTVATQSGNEEAVASYMKKEKLSFPVIVDESGELAKQYGVAGVPVSYVVNSQGQVSFTEIGYTTEMGLRLRLWLAGLFD